jgi:hypothetical protein
MFPDLILVARKLRSYWTRCSGHARSSQPGRGQPHKSPRANIGGLMCWQTVGRDDAGFRVAFIATAGAK